MFASQYWQRNSRTRLQNSSVKYLALRAAHSMETKCDLADPCVLARITRRGSLNATTAFRNYENAARIKVAQTEPFLASRRSQFLRSMANIGAWYPGTCCACQNARAHSIKILGARVRTSSPFFPMRPQYLSSPLFDTNRKTRRARNIRKHVYMI